MPITQEEALEEGSSERKRIYAGHFANIDRSLVGAIRDGKDSVTIFLDDEKRFPTATNYAPSEVRQREEKRLASTLFEAYKGEWDVSIETREIYPPGTKRDAYTLKFRDIRKKNGTKN